MEQVLSDVQAQFLNATNHVVSKVQSVTAEDLAALAERPEIPSEVVIVSLSVACICIGSSWSVTAAQRKRARGQTVTEEDEDDSKDDVHVSTQEAAMFPFVGSAVLLSLYVCYKLFPRDTFNQVLSIYFLVVTTYAVAAFLQPILKVGILTGLISISLSVAWWFTKNFAVNNIIAVAICSTSLWKVKLPKFSVSFLMLWGLFIYDIWWVFGTEVMVSVARNIEAPVLIKLPKNFFEEYTAKNMVMLGLGDIVIPGFFIATCLRFDYFRAAEAVKKTHKALGISYKYFITSLFFYVVGLVNTIMVMLLFQHAQPALLYLVPWITLGTLLVSILTGDVFNFFAYDEDSHLSEEKKQVREKERKEQEEEDATLPYYQTLYNLVVVELFFVEPFRGKKVKTE
eukprot:TRINITY_DN17165_c0_g1_i1.p1 TRINITY_DN17165_c0_g1~~TRINITY_DN17165_c0_g1_i1.p1  ORF type:complete len:419 (+),score=198.29 TRINITY_DN17165_c0_g1_i1:64-1257(+)